MSKGVKHLCLKVAALQMLILLQGCAIGYDSILFATKSNMGVDLDTAPPNLEVAISRQEGVIEPVFEGGQTVPVMASFSAKTNSFTSFFWGVSSTFSTGEAAHNMSYLYDEETAKDKDLKYKKVLLKSKPKPKLPFGIEPDYIKTSEVRPVMFGTDTSLGLKVKWAGTTAQYPSSVNIGFKRKEVAIAPLGLTDKGDNTFEIDVPSLLATIDSDVEVKNEASLTYLQYFATGDAANYLSRQLPVREAMLKRADPGQNLQIKKAIEDKNIKEANRKLIMQVVTSIHDADDTKKESIIAKAKLLELIPGEISSEVDFKKALGEHVDGKPLITSKLVELADFAANE